MKAKPFVARPIPRAAKRKAQSPRESLETGGASRELAGATDNTDVEDVTDTHPSSRLFSVPYATAVAPTHDAADAPQA